MTTIKISPTIRREIAQAIVAQSHPGYMSDYMGEKFAVDTDGDGTLDTVMHREGNAPWNPWNDDAEAISVAALYEDSVCTFDPTPDEDDGIEPDDSPVWDDCEAAAIDLAMNELPDEIEI